MPASDLPKRPWFGWFKLWRIEKAIEWQAEQLDTEHHYQQLLADHEKLKIDLENLVKNHQLNADHTTKTLQHNIDILDRLNQLETRAEEMGMSLGTYEQFQLAQLDLMKESGKATIEVDKTRQTQELQLKFKELSDNLDLDKEREMWRLRLKAAAAYKYLDAEAAGWVVERLALLHERRHQIQFSGQPRLVITEQLRDIDILIEGERNGLTRLVQANNGEDGGRSLQDSDNSGLLGEDIPSGQE